MHRSGKFDRLCCGCGTLFPRNDAVPTFCRICADERLRLRDGSSWTTLEDVVSAHEARIEELEPGLLGIGIEPLFALGRRAMLVERTAWDCIPFFDGEIAQAIDSGGGLEVIAISHPHCYGAMNTWAREFGATILVHEADAGFVPEGTRNVECWSGEHLSIGPNLELHHLGGPFPGATACLWKAGTDGLGSLFVSNPLHVIPSCDGVSFTWRYGDMLPLPPGQVRRIGGLLASLRFDRIYGDWWGRCIFSDARRAVTRSVSRYLETIEDAAAA